MLEDAIIGCTASGVIAYWSQGAEAMFGYAATEAIDQPIAMLAPFEPAEHLRAVLLDIGQGRATRRAELALCRRDGTRLAVMLSALPVHDPDGNPFGASIVVRDVPDDRRLAGELADAQAQLAASKSQMVQLSRLTAMERIALNVAHELNQPLAAIVNYLRAGQRLLADRPVPDLDRLAVALEGAVTQSLHAGRIVGGVRSFVTRGETERRVVSVAALVQHAVSLALPATDQHNARVSLALEPAAELVLVDRVQIEQVLVNLIRNAVEAMRDCPRRDLSIASRSAGGVVEISVTDSGKGISPDLRDRLFEPFATTRRNGTGLGLTICRTIVEAHGGELSCRSATDGGSIFSFTLTGVAASVT